MIAWMHDLTADGRPQTALQVQEITNCKHQITNKFQITNSKSQTLFVTNSWVTAFFFCDFGHWYLWFAHQRWTSFVIWCLQFEIVKKL
jgi:hypothetical protein